LKRDEIVRRLIQKRIKRKKRGKKLLEAGEKTHYETSIETIRKIRL